MESALCNVSDAYILWASSDKLHYIAIFLFYENTVTMLQNFMRLSKIYSNDRNASAVVLIPFSLL